MIFLVPEGPTEYWVDNWVVPAESEHPVAAHKWIDYMLDPVNAGREMNYHQYPVPVVGIKGVDADLAKDPIVIIPDEKIEGYETQIQTPKSLSSATAPTRSSRRPERWRWRCHPRRRAGRPRAGAAAGGRRGRAPAAGPRGRALHPDRQPRPGARACRRPAHGRRCRCSCSRASLIRRGDRRRPHGAHGLSVPARVSRRWRSTRRSSSSRSRSCCCSRSPRRSASARSPTASTWATSRPALDPLYIDVFLRTLRTAAIGTVLIIARRLSALLLDRPLRARAPARPVPRADRSMPFWTSFLIRTYSFLIVLSPEFFLSDWLQTLQLTDAPLAHPQHDDRDPDRPRLQLPAAVRAAALRDARADGLAARRRRDRPRRDASGRRSARSRCG